MKKRYTALAIVVTFALTMTGALAATQWKGSQKVSEIHETNKAINDLFKEHKDVIRQLEKDVDTIDKNTITIKDHESIVNMLQTQYETMYDDLTEKLLAKDIVIQDLNNQLESAYQDVLGIDKVLLKTLKDNKVKWFNKKEETRWIKYFVMTIHVNIAI